MFKNHPATAVFLLATLLAGGFVVYSGKPFQRLDEEPSVGTHLAKGHGFLSPLDASEKSEPTTWMPPGYPFITAAVFKVLGIETRASLVALLLLNAVCFGLIVAAAMVLGRMIFNPAVGWIGAAMVLVHPLFLLRTTYFWHTYVSTAIMLWLAIAALHMQLRPDWWKLLFLGAGLGVLVQTDASLLLVAPVLVWLAVRNLPIKSQLRLAGVSLAGFFALLAPWTIRNYARFHHLMYVRSGFELELWLGNQAGSSGWMDLQKHPSHYPPEKALMRKLGEAKYFELCHQRFREELHRAPGAFVWRCIRRAGYTLIGEAEGSKISLARLGKLQNLIRQVLDWVVLFLGVSGFVMAWRFGFRALWLIALGTAVSAPYLVSHVSYRYAMPVKFILLVSGAFFVHCVWSRWRNGRWPWSSSDSPALSPA